MLRDPQCFGSCWRSTQMVPPSLGQLVKPGRQTQNPTAQTWVFSHFLVQVPQLSASTRTSTHMPPHTILAASHVIVVPLVEELWPLLVWLLDVAATPPFPVVS